MRTPPQSRSTRESSRNRVARRWMFRSPAEIDTRTGVLLRSPNHSMANYVMGRRLKTTNRIVYLFNAIAYCRLSYMVLKQGLHQDSVLFLVFTIPPMVILFALYPAELSLIEKCSRAESPRSLLTAMSACFLALRIGALLMLAILVIIKGSGGGFT